MNETVLNNLISLFCLMPGLVKEAKAVKKPQENKVESDSEAKEAANGQPAKKQKTDASFGQEDKIDLVKDEEENLDEILGLENDANKESGDLADLKLFALKTGSYDWPASSPIFRIAQVISELFRVRFIVNI